MDPSTRPTPDSTNGAGVEPDRGAEVYRVEALARAAGVSVDTVRFYQSRGLLPPPRRRGRVALYSPDHLDRMRRIRQLNRQGLTLAGVKRVLQREADPVTKSVSRSLLGALDQAEGARTYARAEMEQLAGLPGFLLDAIEELDLLDRRPMDAQDPADARYSETDRHSLEAARTLLEAGIPLPALLDLAREHAAHIERVSERAVELFEKHVRRRGSVAPPDAHQVAARFHQLLPAATELVASHFRRTLLRRARARLLASGDTGERARPGATTLPEPAGSAASKAEGDPPV